MARKYTEQRIAGGSGKKSGTGFTRTATNRATGQKTTTTGTTKPVTGQEFNSSGRYNRTRSPLVRKKK